MSRVFISYRRSDSGEWANRLNNHVAMRFGKDLVFRDIESIRPGRNWFESIQKELKACEVFLVVIGPHWLIDQSGRRRLDDPNDVLRTEISEALSRADTVVPILVGNAEMPSSGDLPASIQALAMRQAVSLRDEQWASGIDELLDDLSDLIVPVAEEIPAFRANQELYGMQLRYFDLLENDNAADALELAQKTQRYLNRVMPLYPHDHNMKETRGYIFKNEAMALLQLTRYQEAEKALDESEVIFRTMLEERPRDAGAWNGLGSVEAVRGDYEQAHEYVDKALTILPDYPAARHDHELIIEQLGITCNK
ncbi:MAG: TIR domain-containing protein [Halobacteriota archaeon]